MQLLCSKLRDRDKKRTKHPPRKKERSAYDNRNINPRASNNMIKSLPEAFKDNCDVVFGGVPTEITVAESSDDDISHVSLDKFLREQIEAGNCRVPPKPRPTKDKMFFNDLPPPLPPALSFSVESDDWPSDEEEAGGALRQQASKKRASRRSSPPVGLCDIQNMFPRVNTFATEEVTDATDDGSLPLLSRRERSFASDVSSYSHPANIVHTKHLEGSNPTSSQRLLNAWERLRC